MAGLCEGGNEPPGSLKARQQQQFHAFAFGQRPFLSGHFGSPLDPLQRTDPLSGSLGFRMPAMSNCQSIVGPYHHGMVRPQVADRGDDL
ncbi:hypothetical protein ANN_14335 [Periplaneta americana]|uniref:Uncharacterized protein n=1 Tax=Periplaneta americana TaxID=6978 RepID=A0ABQ8SY55_PERAM|nr:hypothetical protein ANN_14335 [Periplaneta americana]